MKTSRRAFGPCLLAESPRGICFLSLLEPGGEDPAWDELCRHWSAAKIRRDDEAAEGLAAQVFRRPSRISGRPHLRLFVKGTAFQVRVWKALLRIPPGALVSYGQLAAALAMPSSARAVGSAVGANPVSYLIPCHRVIRQTGVLGEYRWGWERKRAMLAWENA